MLCPFAAISPWSEVKLGHVGATTEGNEEEEMLEDVAGTEPAVKLAEETCSTVGKVGGAVSFWVAMAEANIDAGADAVDTGGDGDIEEVGEEAIPAKDSER